MVDQHTTKLTALLPQPPQGWVISPESVEAEMVVTGMRNCGRREAKGGKNGKRRCK